MKIHTAIEDNVLFDISSYIKNQGIKSIKDLFANTPIDPQRLDVDKIYENSKLDLVIRLQTEELRDQDLTTSLLQMKSMREKATKSSIELTWQLYTHLARISDDDVFREFLIRGLPIWHQDTSGRRMHAVMRFIFYTVYIRLAPLQHKNLHFDNFILLHNDSSIYDAASELINNKKYKKQYKKSKKLQKTLLGNSGIKNYKNLKNLKKIIFSLFTILSIWNFLLKMRNL